MFLIRSWMLQTVTIRDCFVCDGQRKWSVRKRPCARSHRAFEEVERRWTRSMCRSSSAAVCDVCKVHPISCVTSSDRLWSPVRAACNTGDHAPKCRIWKVFRLTSRMILWRKQQLERRMDLFQKQQWVLVLEQARHSATGFCRKPNPLTPEEELVRRARQAEKFLHQRDAPRARQALCSQARASGTAATVNELRDLERRPPRLSEAIPSGSQQILASPPV